MSSYFFEEFPFEEIRKDFTNDYFDTAQEAKDQTGLDFNHIWSVIEEDGVYVYGPAHHYTNVIGYIATVEQHDETTYYEEDTNE